jgi:release factor glutamine methyltransferase
MPSTIQQLLSDDAAKLSAALQLDSVGARLEAQYLLQHALQKPRAWLLAHADEPVDADRYAAYAALLQRRLGGEPVAYILGEREFYGLNFKVTPATLIPRPETELLVELALERLAPDAACRLLDLGAGSGAIALSIAHARPKIEVVAVDASAAALQVARENAARLGIANVSFLHGDWYAPLADQCFQFIVSNPPYVAAGDPHLHQGDLRFEPGSALASGADGLDDIRRIAAGVRAHLAPCGWLLLEHGYDQGEAVREILQRAGLMAVFTAPDLAGIDRVSGGQAPA